MTQIIGAISLLLLSILMIGMYYADKERYRVCKRVAIYEICLALISYLIYFIK